MAVTSKHPFEAWEIIRWLSSREGAAALLAEGGMIPVFWHAENLPLAQQLHGDTALEFFREPFYAVEPYFASAYEEELYRAIYTSAERFFKQEISLDQAIDAMERARMELKVKYGM